MARTRPTKSTPATEQPATEAVTTEATEEATVTTVVENPAETTAVEATDTSTEAPATEAKVEKPAEPDLTAFKAAVDAAIKEKDGPTGDLAVVQIESVKAQYQALDGLKAKNAAKNHLQGLLRTAIAASDVSTAGAVMNLVDNACVAGSKSAAGAGEAKPADPAQAYTDRLVALNLAYNLAMADVPEGVNADEARAKATDRVGELTDQADKLYTWSKADAEARGDEPESSPLVKRAVRLTSGKVSGGKAGTGTPHEGPRGNTARHIQLFFKGQPIGTQAKVAEISNAKTDEYPNGNASPGAINSRMKSAESGKSPIEGIEIVQVDGRMGAKKTAEVAGL